MAPYPSCANIVLVLMRNDQVLKRRWAVLNLSGETSVGLQSDHVNMVRFSSPKDNNFLVVLSVLKGFSEDIAEQFFPRAPEPEILPPENGM